MSQHDAHELCVFFAIATVEEKTRVLLEVCDQMPDFLLDIIKELRGPSWQRVVREMLIAEPDKKINAIKECRSLTGLGLKEAKDAVEELMYVMKKEGLIP